MANLIYHVVFSTKNRQPLITETHQPRLYDYIGGTVRGLGGISLALNGTEDHIHLLATAEPTTKVPTQTSHRSSRTGQFVTERQAQRSPSTTERERIKHPERK